MDEDAKSDERKQVQQQRVVDEAFCFMGERLPPLWRRLYLNSIEEGFLPDEALALVKTYILSQCSSGIRGADK